MLNSNWIYVKYIMRLMDMNKYEIGKKLEEFESSLLDPRDIWDFGLITERFFEKVDPDGVLTISECVEKLPQEELRKMIKKLEVIGFQE